MAEVDDCADTVYMLPQSHISFFRTKFHSTLPQWPVPPGNSSVVTSGAKEDGNRKVGMWKAFITVADCQSSRHQLDTEAATKHYETWPGKKSGLCYSC